jgi:nitroreductase
MNKIHRDQLLAQLNWRYATKRFDPQRKISPEDWAALEEALVLSPSSYGLQPWKFIVVNDSAARQKLLPASWDQRQVVDASHLVVFAAKKDLGEQDIDSYISRIAEVRGVQPKSLEGFRDMIVGGIVHGMDATQRKAWAERQVYIALGNFLTSAAVLGIDALEKEGFGTVVAAAAGYRHASDSYAALKKVRFQKEKVLVEV